MGEFWSTTKCPPSGGFNFSPYYLEFRISNFLMTASYHYKVEDDRKSVRCFKNVLDDNQNFTLHTPKRAKVEVAFTGTVSDGKFVVLETPTKYYGYTFV